MKLFKKLNRELSKRNSAAFVRFLRQEGAVIGSNTTFIDPRHANVDTGRTKYLTIGDNCVLTQGISIVMHDYSWYVLANAYDDLSPSGGKPVTIGNNVFIGARTLILGPCTIGDNVIIGAGAVVKGRLEANSVYAGVPAKRVMSLEEYHARRSERFLREAVDEVHYYLSRWNRTPTPLEMKNYAVLWGGRGQEGAPRAILGIGAEKYAAMLQKTEPRFKDYQDFIRFCQNQQNAGQAHGLVNQDG